MVFLGYLRSLHTVDPYALCNHICFIVRPQFWPHFQYYIYTFLEGIMIICMSIEIKLILIVMSIMYRLCHLDKFPCVSGLIFYSIHILQDFHAPILLHRGVKIVVLAIFSGLVLVGIVSCRNQHYYLLT